MYRSQSNHFFFFLDAKKGVPEVIILDSAGVKSTVPAKVWQVSPELWRCEYTPHSVGLHSINILFAGQPIPHSPYGVRISPGIFCVIILCLKCMYVFIQS